MLLTSIKVFTRINLGELPSVITVTPDFNINLQVKSWIKEKWRNGVWGKTNSKKKNLHKSRKKKWCVIVNWKSAVKVLYLLFWI